MKRYLLCLALSAFSIITNAQSIGGFLDFYLGQSMSEVHSITNSKYSSASWDGNRCIIKNISLAGERFDNLYIEFQNGYINEAWFNKTSTSSGSLSHLTNYLNAQAEVHKKIIARLYSAYVSKYGKETVMTDQSITWRSPNGNSVTISLEVHSDDMGFGDYIGSILTRVEYTRSSYGNY